jgi:formylglycine-generating enzyme required for sulfatase activity
VYRLPTEAEWEYAARGGAQGHNTQYAGNDNLDSVAWYGLNSGRKAQRVGTKAANELGLHDMSGNVWEWCQDWYQDSYSGLDSTDPAGPASGSHRGRRGGSWFHTATYCRVAYRLRNRPSTTYYYLGFRVVLAPAFAPSATAGMPVP